MKKSIMGLFVSIMIASPLGFASSPKGECTTETANWKKIEAFKTELLEKKVYKSITKVKKKKSCYEVYAIDQDNKDVEHFYNPVTGEKVEFK